MTTLSHLSGAPPRDTGTTWSTVSSDAAPMCPQYWHVWSSRNSRLRRLGRSNRRGTWIVRSKRTITTPSGRRRPASASAAACSADSSRKATRSLLSSTTRRRWLMTFSGCSEALSSSTAMAEFYGQPVGRGSAGRRQVLLDLQQRPEQVADLGDAAADRMDGPAIRTELGIVQLVPRDRRGDRRARRGSQRVGRRERLVDDVLRVVDADLAGPLRHRP